MKISEIIKAVEDFAPVSLAKEWDRVGLMLGSDKNECTGVISCLDLTREVAEKAKKEGCNLILTHHPFFWDPVERILTDETKGNLIVFLLKNNIAVYSAHTNLDITKGGISCKLAEMFGGNNLIQAECGYLFDIVPSELKKLAALVKTELKDDSVKYVGNGEQMISKCFVVSGAGFDNEDYEFAKANADCFITGDIKHHNYLRAIEDNLSVIEYSHFKSEIIVEDIYVSLLKDIKIKVLKSEQKCPFDMAEV